MNITFSPENETQELAKAADEYTNLWLVEGKRISNTIEQATSLKFVDTEINAIVFEGISQSHPLKLRASYDINTKKATLIHELLHRISADHMINLPIESEDLLLGLHKQIDLLLYDLWEELYGKPFADEQLKVEVRRTPTYKEAWEWALSFSKQERQQKFASLQ